MAKKIDESKLDLQIAYLEGLASGFPEDVTLPQSHEELMATIKIFTTLRHIGVLKWVKTILE